MNTQQDRSYDSDHAPTLSEIEAIATKAFTTTLPEEFRPHVQGIRLLFEDFPTDEVQRALKLNSPFDILSMYQGESSKGGVDRIYFYRRPILDYWAESEESLTDIVRHALVHELGHYFGLSNEDMAEIEAKAERDKASNLSNLAQSPAHKRPTRQVSWLMATNRLGWIVLFVATLYLAKFGYPGSINPQIALSLGLFAFIQPFLAISNALRLDTSGASGPKLLRNIGLSLIGFIWIFALAFYSLAHFQKDAFKPEGMDGLTALYFTVITFATIGYGDIVPNSSLAKFLVVVAVVLSMLFNVVVFTKIVNWLRPFQIRPRAGRGAPFKASGNVKKSP